MIEAYNTNGFKDILGEVVKQGDLAEWDAKTFLICTYVCKLWREIFSKGIISTNEIKEMFPNLFIFGADEWEKYFGEIDRIPAILPRRIVQILNNRCPFALQTLTGKVADTHLLVWCPESIGEKLRTLNSMKNLVKSPLQGTATKYNFICDEIMEQYGNVPAKSQWILLAADILKDHLDISHDMQKKIVTDLGYEIPTVLNGITAVIAKYVVTEEDIFEGTFMICREKVNYKFMGMDRLHHILVGKDIHDKGFNIASSARDNDERCAVVGARMF